MVLLPSIALFYHAVVYCNRSVCNDVMSASFQWSRSSSATIVDCFLTNQNPALDVLIIFNYLLLSMHVEL